MGSTVIETDTVMALALRSDPEQVGITRYLVRAALEYCGLSVYAGDAEIIASELVTNAIQHGSTGTPGDKVGITLMRAWNGRAISIIVTDRSRTPPVKHETTAGSEHGRGLQVVDALCIHWGWNYEPHGKAVYAILAREQ